MFFCPQYIKVLVFDNAEKTIYKPLKTDEPLIFVESVYE